MRETLAEELRLFYVAVTRARDTLILVAGIPERRFEAQWTGSDTISPSRLLAARSYADWLGLWFARHAAPVGAGRLAGESDLVRWTVHDAPPPMPAVGSDTEGTQTLSMGEDPAALERVKERLEWRYPFPDATTRPAKMSVSTLRRQANEFQDDEAEAWAPSGPAATSKVRPGGPLAAGVGTAHHRFLQFVALDRLGGADKMRLEAERLERDGILTAEEVAALDFGALAAFWGSEFGRNVVAQAAEVHRELAFTAGFSARELAELTGPEPGPGLEDELVVVQGVVDLAVILPGEIWLVDFKTDAVREGELARKVKVYEPQLRLYARALERIHRRPVRQCCLHFLSLRTTVPV
jgi:ATP-dependent helicase/nuclease subunit A